MGNFMDSIWFDERRNAILDEIDKSPTYIVRDGKMRINDDDAIMVKTPWIYVGEGPPNCAFNNMILWQKHRLIPAYCKTSCWKVVARPAEVYDLFRMLELMRHMWTREGFHGKCGCDIRWYSPGPYGCYWYNASLEDGLACYRTAKRYMTEAELAHVPLLLKQACTEMQHPHFGGVPTTEWQLPTQDELEEEARLNQIYGKPKECLAQPVWLQNKIMYEWCKGASVIGDRSFEKLGNYPSCLDNYEQVTYHHLADSEALEGGEETQEDDNVRQLSFNFVNKED